MEDDKRIESKAFHSQKHDVFETVFKLSPRTRKSSTPPPPVPVWSPWPDQSGPTMQHILFNQSFGHDWEDQVNEGDSTAVT
jgi:hypothetical protein